MGQVLIPSSAGWKRKWCEFEAAVVGVVDSGEMWKGLEIRPRHADYSI